MANVALHVAVENEVGQHALYLKAKRGSLSAVSGRREQVAWIT